MNLLHKRAAMLHDAAGYKPWINLRTQRTQRAVLQMQSL
jgi:hypothetical protein